MVHPSHPSHLSHLSHPFFFSPTSTPSCPVSSPAGTRTGKRCSSTSSRKRSGCILLVPTAGACTASTVEYTWFIKEGYFVRSPLKVDGVTIGESDRVAAERRWIEREKSRERRAAERAKKDASSKESGGSVVISPQGVQVDMVTGTLEPRFVSAAYFLRFKFDPGHYALAGRESLNGREVLKIEYYPSKLFTEGRTKPDKRVRERDDEVEEKMNKVSLVTLWIDPKEHQILQYTFDNVGLDFLPGRSIVRVDEMMASMKMSQPFPDVWLPGTIEMGFGLSTALGSLQARYDVTYHDYRLAEVSSKIRPPQ